MKKFFTLLTALFAVMAVNAQSWNFSTWEDGSYSGQTKDGLTLNDAGAGKWTVEANTFGDYTKRLKSGGSGYMTFAVEGACKITIAATTSSSSSPRTLTLSANDTEFATLTVQPKDNYSVDYTGGAATIKISMDGGTNFYAIICEAAGNGGGDNPGGDQGGYANKEIMDVSSDAVQALIAASIATPTQLSNPNIFAVSDDKVYPMGTNDAGAVDVLPADGTPITLNSYNWNYNSGHVAFTAVSTPNADAKPEEGWQRKGNETTQALNCEGCDPIFTYAVAPKNGNPTASYKDFFEYNGDGDKVHRVYDGPFFTPGCGSLPAKGCYYEFVPSVDGELKVAFWLNKNLAANPLYIVDASTKDQGYIPMGNDKVKLLGFRNDNTFEKNSDGVAVGGVREYELTNDYFITFDGINGDTNRAFFGYATFNVVADVHYYLFSPKSQPGIFGYQFSYGATDGIQSVTTNAALSSKIYNLAGQVVDASYRGVVIKNGKKMIQK